MKNNIKKSLQFIGDVLNWTEYRTFSISEEEQKIEDEHKKNNKYGNNPLICEVKDIEIIGYKHIKITEKNGDISHTCGKSFIYSELIGEKSEQIKIVYKTK